MCRITVGGGLFNLAVSLARLCGAPVAAEYSGLLLPDGSLACQHWAHCQQCVLLLVDGLGDAFLSANRDLAPNLWRDRCTQISSVFPSTTATALTTLQTAEPPAEHGLLGWFVRDTVSQRIVAPLPMRERGAQMAPPPEVIARLLRAPSIFCHLQREAHIVTLASLSEGPFSTHHQGRAQVSHYACLEDLPAAVEKASRSGQKAQYIYAYTPELDRVAHEHGINSAPAREALAEIDAVYVRLLGALPEALIVVSADHGFIDNPPDRRIDIAEYPDLVRMLSAPLSGEARAAYCHVKPEFAADFGARVQGVLGDAVLPLAADMGCRTGLFGPVSMPQEVRGRIGDWILLARENWVVRDHLPGEAEVSMLGVHGGLSAQEMCVPLIIGGV